MILRCPVGFNGTITGSVLMFSSFACAANARHDARQLRGDISQLQADVSRLATQFEMMRDMKLEIVVREGRPVWMAEMQQQGDK